MVMLPGELISAANGREQRLLEKNNELTMKLLQVTQTLAAVVEQHGTPTLDGKAMEFPAELLEQVFFNPMVAISSDFAKKTIVLFRPNAGSTAQAPNVPAGFDPNW
jgi:hypothetical protein